MKDTLKLECLVPSSLVFGELPKVYISPGSPNTRDTLGKRAEMVHAARIEMQRIIAKVRISRASRYSVPSADDRAYDSGDKVLVWRGKVVNHSIGEWLGPITALSIDASKKIVYVQDVTIGAACPFNVAQDKRYISPAIVAHSLFSDVCHAFTHFSSPDEDDYSVQLTEVIDPRDPRASSVKMSQAKRDEIKGLLQRGTFSIIPR